MIGSVGFSGCITVTVDLDQHSGGDVTHKDNQGNPKSSTNSNVYQLQIPINISLEHSSSAKSIIALEVRKAYTAAALPLSLFPNVLKAAELSIQETLSQIHEEEIAKST